MTIDEANQRMDMDKTVIYHDQEYHIVAINKLNDTVTIAQGSIDKDVKASELDE